jgi:hypothetical protein
MQAAHACHVESPVGDLVQTSLLVYKHLDLNVHTSVLLSYVLDTLSPSLQTHSIDLRQSSLIALSSLQPLALLRSTHHFDCCIASVVTLPKLLLSKRIPTRVFSYLKPTFRQQASLLGHYSEVSSRPSIHQTTPVFAKYSIQSLTFKPLIESSRKTFFLDSDKRPQPQTFFCHVTTGHIFTFGTGGCDC